MKNQDNAIIGIYKIINPKGKVYIGQSINIIRRHNEYKKLYSCKTQIKLYNSLKKYGPENHIFEIIEECSLEELKFKEIYYKQLELDKVNNNFQHVLFCEKYDSGGGPRSEETKKKISNTSKGRKFSPQQKINHYNSLNKRWKDISKADKGKIKHSSEGKQSIREKLWKPILQYNLVGELIKEWPSTNHAAEYYNVTSSAITRNLHNRSKTSCGFKWIFKD